MDAFYASIEERDRPELKGRPLIVGGTTRRGVVAAASYAVRRFGVHSAMPMSEALRRCPHAICVRPRMQHYQAVSAQIFEIFGQITPLVEGLSLDEAFLDVSACRQLLGDGSTIATEIRRRILARTALTASVGIAPNKLLAKIASDLNKPDGMFEIGPDTLRRVLDELPIQKLFGVGRQTLPAVQAAGIRTCGDLGRADAATLWRLFGKFAASMQARALGIDERPVQVDRPEKSISAEHTFSTDIGDGSLLKTHLAQLADRVASRLRMRRLAAGTVRVKIRRADFTTYTRQKVIDPPTQHTSVVTGAAHALLDNWVAARPGCAVRLLGIAVDRLQDLRQADLFSEEPARESRLDAVVDGIRDRFGNALLTRASLLNAADGTEPSDE